MRFSLVGYLPPVLAEFIEPLRSTLVPGCRARAHISVLSPRPLQVSALQAERELSQALSDFEAFPVHLDNVCVFPLTNVLYISVGGGAEELDRLHRLANTGGAHFNDLYPFHPHVTLAQDLSHGEVAEAQTHAYEAWQAYAGPREFRLEKLYLVECRSSGDFVDAAELALHSRVAVNLGAR